MSDVAFLQGQRVRECEVRDLVHARCQCFRGSALVRESALSSVTESPWFVAPASKSNPFAVKPRTPRPGSTHQASSVTPSIGPMNLRSEALPTVALLVAGEEFRGLPYNKSLQATPVPASSAFGRSRRYGGALELRR